MKETSILSKKKRPCGPQKQPLQNLVGGFRPPKILKSPQEDKTPNLYPDDIYVLQQIIIK